jgi:uncharacterized protein (DUF427 family)
MMMPGHGRHGIEVEDEPGTVRISLGGTVLAESTRSKVLHERGLPPRRYLPPEDVHIELLEASETVSECPFKGIATYWHARIGDELHHDVAWSYPDAVNEGEPVRGLIAFFDERVDVEVDGKRQDRPLTRWSIDV